MRPILSLLLIVSAQALLGLEVKAQSQAPSCPSLHISCPSVDLDQPLSISLNVSGGGPQTNLKYKWQLSAGEIVSGQGTPEIKADTTGLEGKTITATVEVDGMPAECPKTISCSFTIIVDSRAFPAAKFDKYDKLSWANEVARLDNFAIQLQKQVRSKGYVIIYSPRRVPQHLSRVRNYLVEKRGIDLNRIVLVNGGHNKKVRTELWIVPMGAEPPKPDPNF